MDGCQFQKKSFTICLNQSKAYNDNYDKIDWNSPTLQECSECGGTLALLGMKEKETGKEQYYCNKCNKKVIL